MKKNSLDVGLEFEQITGLLETMPTLEIISTGPSSVPLSFPPQYNSLLFYCILNGYINQGQSDLISSTSKLSEEMLQRLEEAVRPPGYRVQLIKPYYKQICRALFVWGQTNGFPVQFGSVHLLQQKEDYPSRLDVLTPQIVNLVQNWNSLSKEIHKNTFKNILKCLKIRGLLTLLEMRTTTGSVDHFPPSWRELIIAFNENHSERQGVSLTVGARALSKHAIRSIDKWWGSPYGSDNTKNTNAVELLMKIITNQVWMNIHQLPHNVIAYEVRQVEGYGARWVYVGKKIEFRGFLEPQMEDGHEKGWIH